MAAIQATAMRRADQRVLNQVLARLFFVKSLQQCKHRIPSLVSDYRRRLVGQPRNLPSLPVGRPNPRLFLVTPVSTGLSALQRPFVTKSYSPSMNMSATSHASISCARKFPFPSTAAVLMWSGIPLSGIAIWLRWGHSARTFAHCLGRRSINVAWTAFWNSWCGTIFAPITIRGRYWLRGNYREEHRFRSDSRTLKAADFGLV